MVNEIRWEWRKARDLSHGVKGAPENRKNGSIAYDKSLGKLEFLIGSKFLPRGEITSKENAAFRGLAEYHVKKGVLPESILRNWKEA